MIISAPAKINLFLEVGPPQQGFHPLISIVDIISFQDKIEIEKAKKNSVTFISDWEIPEENSVSESLKLLKNKCALQGEFDIKVFKNIPPGSGLGGGSSNAATVMKVLLKDCKIKPNEREFLDLSALIGKDVPLFISGKRAIIEGFGEQVKEVKTTEPLFYNLFIPNFPVSTKSVYMNMDRMGVKGYLTKASEKIKMILSLVNNSNISNLEKLLENRLSESCYNLYPKIKEVKNSLERRTGKRIFLSGSGGTLFAIYKTRKEAEEKAEEVTVKGWKSLVACSVTTS